MVDEIVAFGQSAVFGAVALVDGTVGIVVAPHGRLLLALRIVVDGARVAEYTLLTDAEVAVLDN